MKGVFRNISKATLAGSRNAKFNLGKIEKRHFDRREKSHKTGGAGISGLFDEGGISPFATLRSK